MRSTEISRRELLASFLGLPVAMAACSRTEHHRFPEGEIIGVSEGIGHKIRDGLKVEPGADNWKKTGVVIIGGGIAGLAAAWRFHNAGFHDYVLLELENDPGGTSRFSTSPVVPYPWGAHYIPAPTSDNIQLVELLDEAGVLEGRDSNGQPVVAEQFLCRDPEERIFFRGRWYEGLYLRAGASREDLAQLDAFNSEIDKWVAWRDSRGRRAFSIPVSQGSSDTEVTALDSLSMGDWLKQKGWGSDRLKWLIDYSCRDDYGLTIDQSSAWAGLFYFASRVQNPGDEPMPLISWPEGNGRLVSHFYSRVRSNVRLGVAVTDVIPMNESGREQNTVIAVDHAGTSATGYRCDRVIFAAPQLMARRLIRPFRDDQPAHLSKFDYGVWMVANLFLRSRPFERGFPLAWDNVLYESKSLGYVVATHQKGLDRGPTVFTYYYPLCEDDPREARIRLLDSSWRELADVTLTDLRRAHQDIYELTERVDIIKWGHAMVRPTPGLRSSDALSVAQKPFRGIHFANTDLSGVPLFEEAFHHGLRAADEVLNQMSRTRDKT